MATTNQNNVVPTKSQAGSSSEVKGKQDAMIFKQIILLTNDLLNEELIADLKKIKHSQKEIRKRKQEIAARQKLIIKEFKRMRTTSGNSITSTTTEHSADDTFDSFRHQVNDKKKNRNKVRPKKIRTLDAQAGFLDFKIPIGLSSDTQKTVDEAMSFIKAQALSAGERCSVFDSIQALTKSINKISDAGIRESVRNLTETVVQGISTETKHVAKDAILLIIFVGASLHFAYARSKTSLILALLAGALLYFFSDVSRDSEFIRSLMGFTSQIRYSEGLEAQVTHDDFDMLATGINLVIRTYMISVTGWSIPYSIIQHLSSFDRAKKSLADIMYFVVSYFEKVVNWVRNNVLDKPSMRFLHSNQAGLDKFFQRADEIYEMQRKRRWYSDEETYGYLCGVIHHGRRLYMDMPRDAKTAGAHSLLHEELRKLERIRTTYEKLNLDLRGFRQETVAVMLRGGPGVGKSILMHYLSHIAMAVTLSDELYEQFKKNPSDFIYNRFHETKYWDGYTANTQVVMFDDFGQLRDVQGNGDCEVMNFIRAVNCFDYNLHMAHVDEKGTLSFGAKFVFATTNLDNWDSFQSISDHGALARRIAIDAVVVPKPQYLLESTRTSGIMYQKFDMSKVPQDIDMTIKIHKGQDIPVRAGTINPALQDFHLLGVDAKPTGKVVGFIEIVKMMVECYKKNQAFHMKQKADVERVMEDFREIGIDNIEVPKRNDVPLMAQSSEISFNLPMQDMDSVAANEFDEDDFLEDDMDNTHPFHKPCDILLKVFDEDLQRRIKQAYLHFKKSGRLEQSRRYGFIISLANVVFSDDINVIKQNNIFLLFGFLYEKLGPRFISAYYCNDEVKQSKYICMKDRYVKTEIPLDRYIPVLNSWDEITPEPEASSFKTWREQISEIFKNVKESPLVESIMGAINKVKKWIPVMIGIALVAAPFIAAFMFSESIMTYVSMLFPGVTMEAQSKDYHRETKIFDKQKIMTPKQIREMRVNQPVAQAFGDDTNGVQLIRKIMRTNMCVLSVQTDPNKKIWTDFGNFMFIKGRIALMPAHFVRILAKHVQNEPAIENAEIRLSALDSGGKAGICPGTVKDIIRNTYGENLLEQDLILVAFPEYLTQPRPDRIKNFATEADVSNRMYKDVHWILPKIEAGVEIMKEGYGKSYDREISVSEPTIGTYSVRRSWEYKGVTRGGDCGSPFCVLNSSVQNRKIFGVHVAGKTEHAAHSAVVTQEMLEEALKEIDVKNQALVVAEDADKTFEAQSTRDLAFEQFNVFGKMDSYPATATNSAIVRSKLHNTYTKTDLAPALLYPREDVDPMAEALKKYCINHTEIPIEDITEVLCDLDAFLHGNSSRQVRPRILSVWEAVYGIEGEDGFNGLPKKTSSGYPMNCFGVTDLKKKLFPSPISRIRDEDPNHTYWELYDLVMTDLNKMKSGIRPFYAFTDFPKDELRPIEKVIKGKTRLISGSPLIYTVIERMYFQAFSVWIMANRIYNSCCVGINPYSSEWDTLARKLSKFDQSIEETMVGAGDHSGFDGRHTAKLVWAVLQVIIRFYDQEIYSKEEFEEHNLIRNILWCEVANARHINRGILYEWQGALSSGHPDTVNINCLINQILFRLCWKFIIGRKADFESNVFLATYGDDVLYTVKQRFRKLFNDITVGKTMVRFGYVFTTEAKEQATQGFRRITDVEFLKRRFRFDDVCFQWVAPLRLQVVLNIPMWTKKGTYRNLIVADNVTVAIRELALHEEGIFETWRNVIVKSYTEHYPNGDYQTIFRQSQQRISDIIKNEHLEFVTEPVDLFTSEKRDVLEAVMGDEFFN